eukprot:765104-Hanusia_phi.AAC.4
MRHDVRTGSTCMRVSADCAGGADVLEFTREDYELAKRMKRRRDIAVLVRKKQERSSRGSSVTVPDSDQRGGGGDREAARARAMTWVQGGFFRHLAGETRMSLAGRLKLIEVAKDETICCAGEEMMQLLVRLSGSVIEVEDGDGGERERHKEEEQGFLCSTRAFQDVDAVWGVTRRASSDVSLLALSRRDYLEVIKQLEDSRADVFASFCRRHVLGLSQLPEEFLSSQAHFWSLSRFDAGSSIAVQDSRTCRPRLRGMTVTSTRRTDEAADRVAQPSASRAGGASPTTLTSS